MRRRGPLEVRRDGRALVLGRGHQRRLLKMLVVRANEFVSTDRLMEQVVGRGGTGGCGQRAAGARLAPASCAGRGRRVGDGHGGLSAAGRSRRARCRALRAMVEDGRDAGAAGRLSDAAAVLREALALRRGLRSRLRVRRVRPTGDRAVGRAPTGGARGAHGRRARARTPAGGRAGAAGRRASPPRAPARAADDRAVPRWPAGGGAGGVSPGTRGADGPTRAGAEPGASPARGRDPPSRAAGREEPAGCRSRALSSRPATARSSAVRPSSSGRAPRSLRGRASCWSKRRRERARPGCWSCRRSARCRAGGALRARRGGLTDPVPAIRRGAAPPRRTRRQRSKRAGSSPSSPRSRAWFPSCAGGCRRAPASRRTGGCSPGLRRSSRSSGGPGRCCSCSTTCTTPSPRRCGSCATWCAPDTAVSAAQPSRAPDWPGCPGRRRVPARS